MRKTLVGPVIMAAGLLGSSAIYASAESTNEAFWGRSICGASLRVTLECKAYTLGKDMPFTVCITNAGASSLPLFSVNGEVNSYRFDLFESDGRPVEALDKRTGEKPSTLVLNATRYELKSGEEQRVDFLLDRHFGLKKAGVYYLIVQRAFIDQGVKSLMSGLVVVHVVE
jgi:hypothetical protein